MKLYFYSGPDCSLCDLAMEELKKCDAYNLWEIEIKNIRDDSELYHRYAVRIPVIQRDDTKQELGWPFNHADVEEFLR